MEKFNRHKPLETQFPLTHLQSPLHNFWPFPWGQSAQEASWWFPQLTIPNSDFFEKKCPFLNFCLNLWCYMYLPTVSKRVHLTEISFMGFTHLLPSKYSHWFLNDGYGRSSGALRPLVVLPIDPLFPTLHFPLDHQRARLPLIQLSLPFSLAAFT